MIETIGPDGRPRRPRAVTLVGWLLGIEGLLVVTITAVNVLGVVLEEGARYAVAGAILQSGNDLIQVRLPVLNVVLGLAQLAAGYGLLRMRPGAWTIAMSIEALSLGIALRAYALGEPRFGPMVLSSIIVLALNQREVRHAFVNHHHHDADGLLHDADR